MGTLLDRERPGLWAASIAIVSLGFYCNYGRRDTMILSVVLFNVLFLLSIEIVARTTIILIRPAAQTRLGELGSKTYNDLLPYKGHPFLQFTGVPGQQQPGTKSYFNNFGFAHNGNFVYEKPNGVIRIATLGGSTTANSYPGLMADFLDQESSHSSAKVEVLNFGVPYWTTAHSLVNFVLNVVDFDPDYVVLHHAWNDAKYRIAGPDFRGDYSHVLRAFERPRFIVDRYLIRTSVLYRYVKFKLKPPDWAFLDNAVSVRQIPKTRRDGPDGLQTYRRNIEIIMDIALIRNIKPVLTTMPHTTDASKSAGMTLHRAHDIDDCNEILRSIAEKYGDRILFVDLDQMMTGKMESVFTDLAHVNESGRAFKAQMIGVQIQHDLRLTVDALESKIE